MNPHDTLTEARFAWGDYLRSLRISKTAQDQEVREGFAELAANSKTEYDRIMLARSQRNRKGLPTAEAVKVAEDAQ